MVPQHKKGEILLLHYIQAPSCMCSYKMVMYQLVGAHTVSWQICMTLHIYTIYRRLRHFSPMSVCSSAVLYWLLTLKMFSLLSKVSSLLLSYISVCIWDILVLLGVTAVLCPLSVEQGLVTAQNQTGYGSVPKSIALYLGVKETCLLTYYHMDTRDFIGVYALMTYSSLLDDLFRLFIGWDTHLRTIRINMNETCLIKQLLSSILKINENTF